MAPRVGKDDLVGRGAAPTLAEVVEPARHRERLVPVRPSRRRNRIATAPTSATIRPKVPDRLMTLLPLEARTLAEASLCWKR